MTTETQEPSTKQRCTPSRRIKKFTSSYGRTSYGGNPIVQQTLPSHFSYCASHIVVPVFVAVCIVFCIIGIVLILRSDTYYAVSETYDHIHRYQYIPSDSNVNINQGIRKFVVGNTTHPQGTRTRINLEITQDLKAPVYFYYTLENFYQNYRNFYQGRSTTQLLGKESKGQSYPECLPIEKPGFLDNTGDTLVSVMLNSNAPKKMKYSDFTYHPCGIAPWSMFNDSFVLYRVEGADPSSSPLTMICNTSDFDAVGVPLGNSISPNKCRKKGVNGDGDERDRFKTLQEKPHLWSLHYPHANDDPYLTNGWYANEPGHKLADPADYDLLIWLRCSVLPNFRKLLRIIDVDLEKGHYVMDVDEFFDVTTLQGKKGFILKSASWVGTESHAMGIGFLVIGCIAFVLAVAFSLELFLRWKHRGTRLVEPKARWYVFDPNSVDMRLYYERRTQRYELREKRSSDTSEH